MDEIFTIEFGFKKLPCSFLLVLLFFFCFFSFFLHLIYDNLIKYSQVFLVYFFSKCSDDFLLLFLFSFFFFFFHFQHDTFFNSKFGYYNLDVDSYSLCKSFLLSFILVNYLNMHVHEADYSFLWLRIFVASFALF